MQATEPRHLGVLFMSLQWLQLEWRLLVRLLIIGGALSGSAYLAQRPSLHNLELLVGLGAVLALIRWPALGLVALVGASLVVRFAIGTGTETNLNIAALLVALLTALWLLEMVLRRELRLHSSPPIAPALVLVAVAVVAFIAGSQPWLVFAQTASLPAQAGGLSVFVLSACAFLLAAHRIPDLRWLQGMVWMFLALGALYIAGRLLDGIYSDLLRHFVPTATGSLFWTWLVALAFSQAAFNERLTGPVRLALGGLVAATLYIGMIPMRDWTSGWLPPLVAVAIIVLVGAPRLAPLVALGGLGMAALSFEKLIGLVIIGDNEYSLMTRVEAWRIMGEIISINPLLGLGFANYSWYTPLFPILGYHVQFNSHNNYVDIIAQTGIVGLACFLWFLWATGRLAWGLRTQVSAGFARAYVYGALGGLVGTATAAMLGDWVLPYIYNIGLDGFRASVLGWVFLGGLVALEQFTRQAPHQERHA